MHRKRGAGEQDKTSMLAHGHHDIFRGVKKRCLVAHFAEQGGQITRDWWMEGLPPLPTSRVRVSGGGSLGGRWRSNCEWVVDEVWGDGPKDGMVGRGLTPFLH